MRNAIDDTNSIKLKYGGKETKQAKGNFFCHSIFTQAEGSEEKVALISETEKTFDLLDDN